MERSRKIFRKIASASRQVVTVANEYADREDLNGVPRCHFQLEEDMRRISVACECLAGILGKQPPGEGPAVDIRIQDWLNTDEPQECLHTLSRMERLLQPGDSASSWMPRTGRGSTATQDKIKEAVDLFHSCKRCFHFLFSTEIWNNEVVQKKQDVPESRNHIVRGESNVVEPGFPVTVQTDIDTTVPDSGIRRDGHGQQVTQGAPDIVDQGQGLPIPVLEDVHTTMLETVINQDRHEATRRRREMKTDKQEEERKLEEISRWLDGLNCAEKQDITLSLRQEDTCKWLFDTDQYKMWRDEESRFLWLRGKPGAGKSVLASFVIDSFQKSSHYGEILAYFYCDFRNERSTSSGEVLRSVLSQLLRQLRGRAVDSGNVIDDLMKAKERGGGTLGNAKELAGFASRTARLSSQKPLVVVDALDECKDIQKLIQALMVIKGHVQLLVTSRPLQTIVDGLSGLPFVSMDDMADKLSMDIELHVIRELAARRRLRALDSGFKAEIRSVLCDKADGMFRWVQCSIDTLDRCVTRKEVCKALNSLPKGLNETYERILLAIDTETLEGHLAQRALIWLTAALRPLQLSELMEGLSINLQMRTLDSEIGPMHSGVLLDACGSLVSYNERTGVVILSHFSVKEYLTGFLPAKLSQYHINWERAHLLLVRSCMCYISICLKHVPGPAPADVPSRSGVSTRQKDQLHPMAQLLRRCLCDYVLENALDHFEHLGPTFESAVHDITVLVQDIQQHTEMWDKMCISARRSISSTNPCWPTARHDLLLYILVAFAPNSLMNLLFRRAALKPKKGTNPLVYAAYFNKKEHVHTLLLQGARLNHRGWETDQFCQSLPIEVAFQNCHYDMVILIVAEGSTVPPHIFTELFIAPKIVPSSVLRILFQTDEFVELNGFINELILQSMRNWLALGGWDNPTEQDHIAIIQRLIQVVHKHSPSKSIGEAFFNLAVTQGHFSVIQCLLTLGIPLPPDLLVTRHPLGKWRTVPMIQLLVDNGANILIHNQNSGDNVLHAILSPHYLFHASADEVDEVDILEAVKLLVGYGCDPLEANYRGQTPLNAAI